MTDSPVVGTVLSVSVLLFLASVFYVANRWMRMPFTVTLVLVGLGLGEAIRRFPGLEPLGALRLSPEVVTYIFMPTLVFQAAFATHPRLLLKNAIPILVLAIPSVLITSVVAGWGLHRAIGDAVGLSLGAALLFGALVSSTDSTAVLTLFRNLGAPKRLTILVDGENLLNDATSIVATRVMLGVLGLAGGLAATRGGTSLYLIGRGVVRVYVGGHGIPEVPIATLHTGNFFGEMAIVSGNPRSASVAAVTHCSLYELRRRDLEAIQVVCPAIQQVLESTASERARAGE